MFPPLTLLPFPGEAALEVASNEGRRWAHHRTGLPSPREFEQFLPGQSPELLGWVGSCQPGLLPSDQPELLWPNFPH